MKGHLAYLKYVLLHKLYVFQASRVVGASWWLSLVHDWSKFVPDEWSAYVHNFYHTDGRKKKKGQTTIIQELDFDYAWNNHQKRQPHHWQYWVLQRDDGTTQALVMPEWYVREMIADWLGAGRAITGRWDGIWGWYQNNKTKMILHPATRAQVEYILFTLHREYVRENIKLMLNVVRENQKHGVTG